MTINSLVPTSSSETAPLEADIMFTHTISLLKTAIALATTDAERDEYSRVLGLLIGVEEAGR